MTRSLWLEDTKSIGFTSEKRKADVIVIGAGLTGLAAAWRLRMEGLDVIVLEASEIGKGTSGHTTGKITSQHHLIYDYLIDQFGEEKARIYADANQWAVREYMDLIGKEGIDCHLEEQSAHVYSHEETDVLEKEYAAATKLGLPCSLDTMAFSRNKVLTFSGQAQFHPRKFMLGLAEKIVDQGGTIIESTRVIKVQEKVLCTVTTNRGTYVADHIVYATLFPILDHTFFALRLRPVMHHGMAFSVKEKEFDGMYIGVNDISYRYFGNTLITVGQQQPIGEDKNPYEILEKKAREKFAVESEITRWSAHDQQSPDRVPFIGSYDPVTDKQHTATGFGAWGITHAMVAAKILTDQISGSGNAWADLYTPWRTGKTISMAIKKGKDTITSLVKGEHLCSHMGCGVVFNQFDQTYDCPCHGSRFDKEGNVLWGPAVKGIRGAKKKSE
ncbi:MAG: FAD-dependent oxidoreductase [Desulforhopalus sp.]